MKWLRLIWEYKSFLNSGCDVITTSSYQMSIDLLTEVTKCSQVEAKEFIKKSVYIAIEARKETNKCKIYILLKNMYYF